MPYLRDYILSTFNYCIDIDSTQPSQYSTLSLLENGEYNVYITPIRHPNFIRYQDKYDSLLKKAFNVWSEALFEKNVRFNIIETPHLADIKVYWTKANTLYAGMQFMEENLNFKKRSFAIGIAEMDWEPYTEDEVYHIMLHEIGHVFGLGHSNNKSDVMSPCGNWSTTLSQNDLKVLNLAYAIGNYKSYLESIDFINNYLAHWNENNHIHNKYNANNNDSAGLIFNMEYTALLNLIQPDVQVTTF